MPFEVLPCWCLLQGLKPQCLGDLYPVIPGVPCASLRGFPPAAGLTATGVHSPSRPDPQCSLTQGSKVTWKGLAALDRTERGVGGTLLRPASSIMHCHRAKYSPTQTSL